MMGVTSIEWTDRSVNPIRARHKTTGAVGHYCELVSPGCAHCYSSTLQRRFNMPPFGKKHSGDVDPFMDESKLRDVLGRKKPTKFFWEDMSDLFGAWVKEEWIDQCFATMAFTHQHTHQVLTKRPERMRDYVKAISRNYDRLEAGARTLGRTLRFEGLPLVPWPIPSVWLGVSVEDRKHGLPRIDVLRAIPACVRFLSIEPLLEDLGEIDLTGISWVIVGGESGHGARPCHPAWVRSIRDQCKAAGVAFFFKQWGEWKPIGEMTEAENDALYVSRKQAGPHQDQVAIDECYGRRCLVDTHSLQFDGKPGHRSDCIPGRQVPSHQMFRLGKKVAGRLLDGVEHSEFPKPETAR